MTEGEDLLEAGLAGGRGAGVRPGRAGGARGRRGRARAARRRSARWARATRVIGVWPQVWAEPAATGSASTCTASATPATSGPSIRTAHALVDGPVVLGPGLRRPATRRRRCGRAWARSSRRRSAAASVAEHPEPARRRWSAHGGERACERSRPPATLCLGAEREGCPRRSSSACDRALTIPLRAGGAESLNVAAGGGDRPAADIVGRMRMARP